MSIVMGTAGHIDHGKTSLVKALTGTDCDRLEEEKRRGITIELGFASLALPDGTRLGIVDVPGHEKFVRNMVAGATGIDFVLLVIAADEGVMPQTREHLEICSLLGIRHGMVALTKTDMVDEEMLELAKDDVSSFLKGTFLEECPILPVSSATGQGLDGLRAAIVGQVTRFRTRYHSDVARLPVDRVFSLKGHGTIVTGTLLSGKLGVKDEVELFPSGHRSRVKGIQNHGNGVETALPGHRISLNLPDLEVDDIARGEIVAHPGTMFPSKKWLMRLTCLSSSPRGIRQGTEIHFHHGTKELTAKPYFFGMTTLRPGETALTEIRFDEPMAAIFDDRCVIRAFSPLRTIAGGAVLNPLSYATRFRRIPPEMVGRLLALETSTDEVRVETQVRFAGGRGVTWPELETLTCFETRRLEKAVQALSQAGRIFCFHRETRSWVAADFAQEWERRLLGRAAAFHAADPLAKGMSRGYLLTGMGDATPQMITFAINRLVKSGKLVVDGDVIRTADHRITLVGSQSALNDAVLRLVAEGGFAPPVVKELCAALDVAEKTLLPILRMLVQNKDLVKVNEELYFRREVMEDIKGRLRTWFETHSDLKPADFKDLVGVSRKFAIPILEHLDGTRFTMRVGNQRILRNGDA